PGNGGTDTRHGYCAPNPVPRPPTNPKSSVAGECPNHQLEYGLYYAETMRDILGDFGVTIRRYEFENPGGDDTLAGRAINVAAVVPGADHPDETIIIGAHYDQTTGGPASTWDSAEGHAQVIRVAKIMADYWRATGTRPSATVKFIPWDGEETGTLGSLDYAQNNVVPGEEHEVRAYFNTDPCAGGYPAFRYGNPADRVDLGIQIADEETVTEFPTDRITAFNEKAPRWVEEVFDRLDDDLTLDAGVREIFVSTSEARPGVASDIGTDVFVDKGRPQLFSSDWRNFEALGIPFFNPGPEITGPDSNGEPYTPDALAILHTPNDNQNTLNDYAGNGPTQSQGGTKFAEGWIKGMEMCAQLLSHGMLQPEMGGGQTANGDVVAYYEALPNEALQNQAVRFDASGTYQYTDAGSRAKVAGDQLEYTWDFGDGTTGTGREVSHGFPDVGVYQSKLTVRNVTTGQTDTMAVPITVIGSNFTAPVLSRPPAEDEDGTFPLKWTFDKASREGFERYLVEESTDYKIAFKEDAEGPVEERWNVEPPTHPDIAPWQKSDSSTNKVRRNQAAEGKTSYWSGVPPEKIRPAGVIPQGISQMTLKERFLVPKGSSTLSFASIFQMEGDDRGVVEIATAEAPEQFEQVTALFATMTAAGETDPKTCDPSSPETFIGGFERHSIDIGQYSGKEIILRFKLVSGAENRALSQPCGWYVDDISVAGGKFTALGESLEEKFEVRDRTKGTYAYRVRGVYADGVRTGSSNVETVTVTRGAPAGGSVLGGSSKSCEPSSGFEAVAVKRLKKGRHLRFAFARRALSPVRIDVFQDSAGRRILRNRLVARFKGLDEGVTWKGRDRKGRRMTDGYYFVRFRVRQADGRFDRRRVTLRRENGRFFKARRFHGRTDCGLLASAKLRSPVFGGLQKRSLVISFTVTKRARVVTSVFKGRKRVYRSRINRAADRTKYLVLPIKRLKAGRGVYRVRIVARSGKKRQAAVLYSRRL
ncbi:MAG TPA: M28 family peptidase, partial [Acidimicrobiales bacterium]|nr:M28 family peptidase [Acidimicrobiales bacterium]